jgi:hypothetical protein
MPIRDRSVFAEIEFVTTAVTKLADFNSHVASDQRTGTLTGVRS